MAVVLSLHRMYCISCVSHGQAVSTSQTLSVPCIVIMATLALCLKVKLHQERHE